jgi:hypothetical protein
MYNVRLPKPAIAMLSILALAAAGSTILLVSNSGPTGAGPSSGQNHPARETGSNASRPLLPWAPVEQADGKLDELEEKPPANSYLAMAGIMEDFSADQIEPYLHREHRSAESLVAAAKLTRDVEYLREAVRRFPENPRGHFALAMSGTPDERMDAIQAFRNLEPDNSAGDYLLALELFRTGDRQGAIDVLLAADGKTRFMDYGSELAVAMEDALLGSGFTPLQACAFAYYHPKNDFQTILLRLGGEISDLQAELHESGKESEIAALAWSGLDMLRHARCSAPRSMINEATDSAVTKVLLKHLPPDMLTPDNKTVAEIRAEADALTEEIFALADFASNTLDDLGEEDALRYYRSIQRLGEMEALRAFAEEKRNQPR